MGNAFSYYRTWYLVAILLTLCLLFLFYLWRRNLPAMLGGEGLGRMTAFAGGTYEASGVAGVHGTDGVLFVDNGRPGKVFWMRLDQNGKQVGAIKTINLGVQIEDLEGITTDGTYFYVVSSQARPKTVEKAGLARFKFNVESQVAEGVESIQGLKEFLLENLAELRDEGRRKGKHGGINIEGIAWDSRRGRLLLALRSPIIDEHALIAPLRLRNPRGVLSVDNLEVAGSKLIRLPLGGSGIRGIEYDGRKNVFRLIAGAAEDQDQTDFVLWEWNGDESQTVLKETTRFNPRLKPEGVARVTVGSRDFIFIVFDAGGYTVMD